MPSSLHIFSRNKDDDGRLEPEPEKSPRWSISSKSPKSPRFPKSPRSPKSPGPLTRTEKNSDQLNQCMGCKNVNVLIRRNIEKQDIGTKRQLETVLHDSFNELDGCARKCQICRVFRQALYLQEVTFEGADNLQKASGKVIVRWSEATSGNGKPHGYLEVSVKSVPEHTGVVHCNKQSDISHLALHPDGYNSAVIEQAKKWLHICRTTHVGQCDNLKYSSETPRLLIEILSDRQIQLCKRPEAEYVALSYCWGDSEKYTPPQKKEIDRGMTNKRNEGDRHQPFSIATLPSTVRDALQIIRAMDIRYAWIDTLCINQDTKEGVLEMHKVYSNALFTLSSCATTTGTARFLDQREAWSLRTEPCRLGGLWLTTSDMSLNELRLRSPLAARAWTLQEERLSPRILYVTSNRMYWSCAVASEMEMKPSYDQKPAKLARPVYAASDRNLQMPQAQRFLLACAGRNAPDNSEYLHGYWTDIVKSYAMRDMGNPKDRLTALSGVAAKYLGASKADEYLAGLWSNNLADGLVWKAQEAVDHSEVNPDAPKFPSWSWAKLPYPSEIEFPHTVGMSPQNTSTSTFRRLPDDISSTSKDNADEKDAVERGQHVRQLRVRGRTRALWSLKSIRIDWSSITQMVEKEERYTFADNPERDVHAIHPQSGRIVVYEDRKREVICQLDFKQDVIRLQKDQIGLLAFEVGETTMLLLEHCGARVYRRVGAAWNVRRDFFTRAECKDVFLQ